MSAILTDPPPRISDPQFAPLEPIIKRALAKPITRRFQSAVAMKEALSQCGAADPGGEAPRKRRQVKPKLKRDPEAEKVYLRGRVHWNKRHPDAMRQAIACFQEAVERDPLYANAYAGLADAYVLLGFLQALPPSDIVPKAKASALRAIELDPDLAEPHASLGYVAGMFEWDWPTADRELNEAMRINPNYPWAPHWYGLLLVPRVPLEESMKYVRRAQKLDPLSPIINTAVGIPLHFHRQYEDAVRVYSNVRDSEPSFAPVHYYLAMSYEQMGNFGEATRNLERACEIAGRGAVFVGALGHCYGRSGRHDDARALLRDHGSVPFNASFTPRAFRGLKER
jgi:tetratricopeptide (TPR) repeat protein